MILRKQLEHEDEVEKLSKIHNLKEIKLLLTKKSEKMDEFQANYESPVRTTPKYLQHF